MEERSPGAAVWRWGRGGRARGICCLKVTLGPSDIYGRGAGRPSTHSRPPFPHRTAFATRLPPRPVPCRSAASGWGTGVYAPAREAGRKWGFGTASLLGAPRQISPPPTISTKPSVVTPAAGVLPGGGHKLELLRPLGSALVAAAFLTPPLPHGLVGIALSPSSLTSGAAS